MTNPENPAVVPEPDADPGWIGKQGYDLVEPELPIRPPTPPGPPPLPAGDAVAGETGERSVGSGENV